MRIRYYHFALILLLAFTLQAQDGQNFSEDDKRLEWAPVEGAYSYLVEIESDGVILHSIETTEPFLPLFLSTGEYRIRISVFNKFKKLASRGAWSPLTIYPNPQPIIESNDPGFFYDDNSSITFTVEGKDFDENCRFFLVNGTDRIEGKETARTVEEEKLFCLVTFSDSTLPELGEWDLTVLNPSGKEFTRESAVRFGPRILPSITSMTPGQFFIGSNPGKIVIEGENFSNGATLIFEGPSPVPYSEMEIYYGTEITFRLNTDNMTEGSYGVSVENENAVISDPLEFTVAPKPEEKAEKARKEREKAPFFIGGNYHLSFPTGDDGSDLFDPSPMGLGFAYRQKFRNQGVYGIPFLRNTGVFSSLNYTFYTDAIMNYITVAQFMGDIGLFYLSDWDRTFNLYLSIGSGMAYSFYFFDNGRIVNSFDFTNRLESGLQFEKEGVKYEIGWATVFNHFQSNMLVTVNPYFLIGWDL